MSTVTPAAAAKRKAELLEKVKSFLFHRQAAYKEVFKPESQMALRVLDDLSKFCREKESCFHMDPRAHAVAEGRREVILRIRKHLDLTSEELLDYYRKE
jgi:hypothetical protein